MVDWKKEVKLSDLVRRKAKDPDEAKPRKAEAGEKTSRLKKEVKLSFRRAPKADEAKPRKAEAGEKTSRLKKEVKLSFRRGPKTEKPAREKPPREPRRSRRPKPATGQAKGAPPLPQVPLMRAFNLLPRDDGRQARKGRPGPAQLGLAVGALLLLAVYGSAFLFLTARVADKRNRYNELSAKLEQLVAAEPEAAKPVDPELVAERQKRTTALAAALAERVAWDRLLREFSLVLPEDVWLTSLIATRPARAAAGAAPPPGQEQGSTFTINGYTRAQDGVARLLARLTVLPELASVQLLSSTVADVEGEEVVQFSISATVKTPGGAAA